MVLLTKIVIALLEPLIALFLMESTSVMNESPSQGNIPEIFRLELLNSTDLFKASIPDLQGYLSNGTFTSVEYVRFCLDRIQRIDPYLEAVIETNPDALEIAALMDAERHSGNIRGPLHGIPVMVKDNIGTKDKMQTTCGSWALLGSVVPRDAFVVSLLRKAGAIILGHTNMSEWASLRSSLYSDGYSPRRGQVRNPYYLSRSPFGSSGGSAVAVAANLVPVTFGTETDGSVIGPAQINAVVGFKPTPGLTSRSGVIPSSETFDTVGSIAKTVVDVVIGLNAIVGVDDRDPLTSSSSVRRESDYSQYLSTKADLKGAKFGLPIKGCWDFVADDQKDAIQKVLNGLKQAGAEIVHVNYPCAEDRIAPNGKWNWELGTPAQSEFTVIKTEAYNSINAYLSGLSNTPIKTFEDIIEFNKENSGTEGAYAGDHPAFPTGQDTLEMIAEHQGQKDEDYYAALKYIRHMTRDEGIDAALKHTTENGEEVQLDALILCDRRLVGQQIAAQAGYPTITIPIGIDKNSMPVGITLQQTAWQEGTLIKWGSAIEDVRNEVMGGRPLPEYKDHFAKNIPIGRKPIKD